jgi:hypothetical protein
LRSISLKAIKLTVAGAVLGVTLFTDAKSGDVLECGDELRVVRRAPLSDLSPLGETVIYGKLLSNENGILTLDYDEGMEVLVIGQQEIIEISSLRRHTTEGAVFGVLLGGAIGVVAARSANSNSDCENDGIMFSCLGEINSQIATGVALVGGGMIFGGIIGGALGNSSVSYKRIEFEAVPLCYTGSGDLLPFKMNLSINF